MLRRLGSEDGGAILVTIAASMLFLLGVAAIAVDLGSLRSDIRSDSLVADAAVTAGVASVDPFSGGDAEIACQVAWEYVLLNLEDEGGSVSAPNCAALAGTCTTASAAVEVTATAGPYSVGITHPVPDGHPLMGVQAVNTIIDGVSCQRLGVSIARTRQHWFARIIGAESGMTTARSVARNAPGVGGGEVVPLLVLEPFTCDALYTSGQGKITVSYEDPDTPGFIVVDSNGSGPCNPNSWTIDSKGIQNGWIRAIPHPSGIPSAILSYALSGTSGSVASRSFDPGDLATAVNPADITDATEPAISRFRLFPQPSFVSRRITRAAIDHRYNCNSAYPNYLGAIPISPCLDTPAPHIDNLKAAYGSSGPAVPMGFNTWPSSSCNVNSGTITVTGNWYVDCTGPSGFVVNGATVQFVDGDVVFAGNVEVRSGGVLRVNPSPTSDHVVVLRDAANNTMRGNLTKVAQATIELNRTIVYLENGKIDLVGGAGGLTWTAPTGGNFEDLALWSEVPEQHQIGGQAGNTLEGTFFTPYAVPFSLTGQAGQFQTNAQFITRRLEVGGQGEVKMHPDPDRTTKIPIREVRLIR